MLRHIVMFRFAENTGKSREALLRETEVRAQTLSEIPYVKRFEVRTAPNGTPRENYDIALFLEFEDIASLTAYRDHPVHVAFRAYITPLREKRASFDYVLQAETREK